MKTADIPFIILDDEKNGSLPLYRQIYESIRRSILSGEYAPKTRLPSTRMLADKLGVSRMTVVNAFDQLLSEGYIEGKLGAGTFVACQLPDELLRVDGKHLSVRKESVEPRCNNLSRRGQWLASSSASLPCSTQVDVEFRSFQCGVPAVDKFPFAIWSKLAARRFKNPPVELLGYGDPAGYLPLREAIVEHLKSARAVQCDASQVIIVAGSQQALDMTARVLLNRNDIAYIEDPYYHGAHNVFLSTGANVIPVPVDSEGLDSNSLENHKKARLVYVTPSHQFPLGVTMSLSRRFALLQWAKQNNAWIIEDDYNSEFRYSGRPLASLQGLDKGGRVIYIGTFSKTIFPALRLGCIVVPKDLTNAFIAARALSDRHSPSLDQAVLADFMEEGHFARHIRRMRALYEERQHVLVKSAARELDGLLEVSAADSGMHLIGWLPKGVNDKTASENAARYGVETTPLSTYTAKPLPRGGLMLGYSSLNAKQIKDGVKRLAKALNTKL